MKAQGLARIGRDAEVRYLPNGDPVVNLSLAFTYGRKGEDGKRPTQWVDATFWGQRGETLAQWLLKGSQVVAYLDEIHIETYEGKNGTASKLAGRVVDIELISDGRQRDDQGGQQQPQQRQQQPQRQQAAPRPQQGGYQQRPPQAQRPQQPVRQAAPMPQSGFDDDDSDIPFITSSMAFDMTTSKARKMSRYDY